MTIKKAYDAVVIGAGVEGCSCAYHLVKKGFKVALIERKNVARETSSHCDAAALLVDKLPGADAAFGNGSIKQFLELQDEVDEEFGLVQKGCVYVCDTPQEMQVAADYAKSMRDDGYDVRTLDPKELVELEPNVATDLQGGLYSPIDIALNPFKFCFALVDQVAGKGLDVYKYTEVTGIKLGKNNEVEGVETDKGFFAAKNVVNACGVWAPMIGEMVGINIPIKPRKGVILLTTNAAPFNFRKVQEFGYMISKFSNFECKRDPELEKYGVSFTIQPTDADNVMVGSSRNFSGYDVKTTEIEIVHTIAKRAIRFYPCLKDMICIRAYAGLRPFIATHLPLITDVKSIPGFYIAAGHEGDGISMSPATGRAISEMMAGEETFMDMTPFSYESFLKEAKKMGIA